MRSLFVVMCQTIAQCAMVAQDDLRRVLVGDPDVCKNPCMSMQANVGVIPVFTRGDRMRVALRSAGIGVQEMADYLEVSRGTVSTWLNDKITPGKQTLRLWAIRTGVPLVWLETGQAPTMPSGPVEGYTTRDSNPEPAGLVSWRLRAVA